MVAPPGPPPETPPFPAGDPVEEHGARFPALQPSPGGGFTLVWIDASDERRSVRSTHYDPGSSSWSEPVTVDSACCACCWNALATVGDEEVFVYRNVEPSDMFAARTADGGQTWSDPVPVASFGWNFDGCPHVGAGLAAEPDGGRLFAAVWTGKDGETGLYRTFSDDAGASWSPALRLGPAGATHPRLAAMGNGRVAAAWTQNSPEESLLVWAISEDRGESWVTPQRLSDPFEGDASHALLTVNGDRLTGHWTVTGDDGITKARSSVLEPARP